MILEIATIGHSVLREVARPVTLEELATPARQQFIDDLIATMRHADGAGLAANQVYEPVRICVVEVRAGNPRYPNRQPVPLTVFVNPVVTPLTTDTATSYEGCLSVPELRAEVTRITHIRVDYLDRHGAKNTFEASGFQAVALQHELDHLDGKLFTDRADISTLTTWQNLQARAVS